jgi:hypothetical protein
MEWTLGSDGSGPVTRLIGGHFWFDDANALLLDGLLPDVVEIRSSNTDASRLHGMLDLIGDEASTDSPGAHPGGWIGCSRFS